eukprot:CAMPEP_0170227428 /NCGR_PEP_ID=MMETSP0116_2-20130129/13428_1 /TAXON_ID=400756 /ORGANISM="Durinskia baltica, Strain CSIRO CS-38" /LENGTH=261 /DNA_ID=CAMNT_0010478159 /DNA_START=81 /DNA_END=867 /DNA_ORIENTATION=-
MARQSAADSSFEESEGEVRLVAKNTFLAVVEVPAAGAIARSQSDGALSISGSYQSSGWSSSRTSCASSATNSDALVWDAQLNLIEAREGTMRQPSWYAINSDGAQQLPAPPSPLQRGQQQQQQQPGMLDTFSTSAATCPEVNQDAELELGAAGGSQSRSAAAKTMAQLHQMSDVAHVLSSAMGRMSAKAAYLVHIAMSTTRRSAASGSPKAKMPLMEAHRRMLGEATCQAAELRRHTVHKTLRQAVRASTRFQWPGHRLIF